MEPIIYGMSGAAVEDVQDRLARLGYLISEDEKAHATFSDTTRTAVLGFRERHDLGKEPEVDSATWVALVSEGYELGDRTLYLRLPNFHGNDVRILQHALNTLGFSCGAVSGNYDAHTEAAVRQFQENVGLYPDGMCFQDTFEAIWHLKHVWADEKRARSATYGVIGFARAASVLEETVLALSATDPISRNVAGRIWNLASATSEHSGLVLLNHLEDAPANTTCIFELSCAAPDPSSGFANVTMERGEDLPRRIRTAFDAVRTKPPLVRVELPSSVDSFDGSFTTTKAQMLAMTLLDALCAAFAPGYEE